MWPWTPKKSESATAPHRRHLRPESSRFDQAVITATRFWRNGPQLAVLAQRVLPALAIQLARPLRVAVHAGSTGCEALSLLAAAEHFGCAARLEVLSLDIDPDAIQQARANLFPAEAMTVPGDPDRLLPPPQVLERSFERTPSGQWRVAAHLHERVRFEPCDLTDAQAVARFGRFDLLSCQNVLVHLSPEAALAAIRNLAETLEPGGLLALGGTPPDQLAYLTGEVGLLPLPLDNRAVYEAWSGRHELWRRHRGSHLGLEPFDPRADDAERRYAHLFMRDAALMKHAA